MTARADAIDAGDKDRAGILTLAVACLVVFAAAVTFRLGLLHAPLFFDEYYHVLAGQGLLDTGTPSIGTGLYDRGLAYTWFVSRLFALPGEDVTAARLSSIVGGSLLIVLSFLWLRHYAGWIAAFAAAALAILSPLGIEVANTIRFYVWQGLAVFVFAACIYAATVDPMAPARRAVLALAGFVSLGVGLYLQPLSALAAVGVGLWWGLAVFLPWAWRRQARVWIIGAAVCLGALALAGAVVVGAVDAAWDKLRYTPDWASIAKDAKTYYYRFLRDNYAVLWPLFPVAVLAAIACRPRPALFCTVVFAVAFVFLSLGGMKSWRYIYFVLPYLFAIYGIALSAILVPAWRGLISLVGEASLALFGRRLAQALAAAVAAFALLFLAVGNQAFIESVDMARGDRGDFEPGDWAGVTPVLSPYLTDDRLIVTPRELHALYHFGRADVTVSVSRLSELEGQGDFATDPRTGLPTVGTVEGAARLVACTRRGLFIGPVGVEKWVRPIFPEPAQYDGPARLTDLPEVAPYGLEAILWETPSTDAAACADVPDGLREF